MPLLSVRGAEQLQALARDLRAAGDPGKGLRRELRKNITQAVKPMQAAVQSKAEAIPTTGSGHTGLRAAIAKATRIRTSVSQKAQVTLEVAPSRMPSGQRSLPARMDGRGRWRHPVFGNRNVWVNQASHQYFWPAVAPHIQGVRQAVIEAVERTINRLARKG